MELGRQGLNLLLRLRGEGGGKLVRGEEGKELTNRIDSIPVNFFKMLEIKQM